MTRILSALKLLFTSPGYLLLTFLVALTLFAVYFVINDLALYRSAVSISGSLMFLWKVFANHVFTVAETSSLLNVFAVGVVSLLGGFNLSLTVLRVLRTKIFIGRASLPGVFGTLGGAFAASCTACSTALISLLGVSGGLVIFPFGGLEISLLAAVLLIVSLYYVSKSLSEFGLAVD